MEIDSLIGKSFEYYSFDAVEKFKWKVTRVNPETKYVYVERETIGSRIGQWIPAQWFDEILAVKKLRLKNDSLRKSRDYFKGERDELNIRLGEFMAKKAADERALIEEIDFVKMEMIIAERDLGFWKSFALYATASAFILFGALTLAKYILC
jgi:hypothetical protein